MVTRNSTAPLQVEILKHADDTRKNITAFDLQQNPASLGLKSLRIEKSKDKHFWSVRVA